LLDSLVWSRFSLPAGDCKQALAHDPGKCAAVFRFVEGCGHRLADVAVR
jgi:hypothetical protein